MKRMIFTFVVPVIMLFVPACDNSVDNQPGSAKLTKVLFQNYIVCTDFKQGLIDLDQEIVKSEINRLISGSAFTVPPSSISEQEMNFNKLVNQLNTICSDISAESVCYACIKTNPPQSEILLSIRSSEIVVKRVVDILTPADSELKCLGVHE